MNAITYAIDMIKNTIPREILELAFLNNINYKTVIPVTPDSRIKELIINRRVFNDINVIGGTHITVSLNGLPQEYIQDNAIAITVPKSRTQGRSILTAHSVSFGSNAASAAMGSALIHTSEISNVNQQMMNSVSSIPYMSEAQVMLISENTVMIQGMNSVTGNLFLRCEIENDSNINNIKRRSYLAFGELCVKATKAYIYLNTVIPMDIGYIEGGATLNKLREIIESYDDEETEYLEFLKTKWAKVNKLNDAETVEQLVRITTGGAY